jgi:hypothetical protein
MTASISVSRTPLLISANSVAARRCSSQLCFHNPSRFGFAEAVGWAVFRRAAQNRRVTNRLFKLQLKPAALDESDIRAFVRLERVSNAPGTTKTYRLELPR